MKVAIINNTARIGSTGKIAYGQYVRLKADGHSVQLYYGRTKELKTDEIHCIDSRFEIFIHGMLARITGLHGYFSNCATSKLLHMLDDFKPDIVQLYNLHGYYLNINRLLRYLKKKEIPTVYSMLDEFPYLGRNCYLYDKEILSPEAVLNYKDKNHYPITWTFTWNKNYYESKKELYARNNMVFAGPQWVTERAVQSGLVKQSQIRVVDEYVETEKTFYPRDKYSLIEKELLDTDKKIIIGVAPYSSNRKGGNIFINIAERFEDNKNYIFVYVGMDVKNVKTPGNCIVKGYIYNQDMLAEYYSIADLHVCPSLADTMPNSCLDALACGTPVIGFKNTGVPYIADEPMGQFVENKDVEALCELIRKSKKKDREVAKGCREYALSRYTPEVYYRKMYGIYEGIDKANG